jgi:hypothetical protein
MNAWKIAALLAAGMIVGCMASGPALKAQSTQEPRSAGTPARSGAPLLLDRTDLRIGTTVHFSRIPDVSAVNDLRQVRALAHVVLALDAWPTDVNAVAPLEQVPEEADVVVVLPGYPPSRAAGELWNYLGARVRLVMLVEGPPPTLTVIDDMNNMRHLERVIADMDMPARTGFERLQRPLSFRKIIS